VALYFPVATLIVYSSSQRLNNVWQLAMKIFDRYRLKTKITQIRRKRCDTMRPIWTPSAPDSTRAPYSVPSLQMVGIMLAVPPQWPYHVLDSSCLKLLILNSSHCFTVTHTASVHSSIYDRQSEVSEEFILQMSTLNFRESYKWPGHGSPTLEKLQRTLPNRCWIMDKLASKTNTTKMSENSQSWWSVVSVVISAT